MCGIVGIVSKNKIGTMLDIQLKVNQNFTAFMDYVEVVNEIVISEERLNEIGNSKERLNEIRFTKEDLDEPF